ncbi:hypothetical protein J4Q44_G00085640 [Coregonus suidteri]|uniref:Reverse transcriptase n=1 Tax=Coregonus suidteri TaxID=861788 RepID=A0AAN8R368_9TELE
MVEHKQCSYSLRKAIKQAKRQYRDQVESQFNGTTITDYKGKTSHVADPDVLLPDKLNTFFARFEDNTVPPTRPAPKDCGLSFSVAHVSKTFKRVNPCKAAGPDSIPSRVLRACADQLAGVFTDIFNLSLSQSAVPTSRCPPLYPRKQSFSGTPPPHPDTPSPPTHTQPCLVQIRSPARRPHTWACLRRKRAWAGGAPCACRLAPQCLASCAPGLASHCGGCAAGKG